MATRLPALPALRAFDAVARLGSLTRAAEALHLTHGAISHQIKALESDLGASLLERADVRSWHLLPSELTLLRLRLPAGPQRVTLRIGDGAQARTVEVGTVQVRAGSVELAPVRLWQAPLPAPVAAPDSLQPRP